MNHLIPFWFIVIAILWTGFFILEGFDFGVGMLHGVVGQDEAGRRAAINTIGPLWDGNEVWLIVAGASMFAAFPGWYATMFSALYLALVLLLISLIIRGVAFEYRGKRDAARWRRTWDVALTAGSLLAPLVIMGLGLGLLYAGVQTAANAGVPEDQAGLAAALITTSFQLGSALGLAVFSGIASSRTHHLLAARTPLPEALTAGFQRALLVSACCLVVAGAIALRASNTRGEPAATRETQWDSELGAIKTLAEAPPK